MVTLLGISAGKRFLKLKVELLLPKGSITHLVSATSVVSVPGTKLRVGKI